IGSAVRNQLLPGRSRPSFRGRTVWRGITPAGSVWPIEPSVTVGRGIQFGMLPMPDRRVYWFLTANADAPGVTYDDERAEVRRRVGSWHDPIARILDATPADQVLHHDIVDLDPVPAYTFGRVALLGDAAHAMTPDLGQGACQAIEDAVVVVDALRSTPDLAEALATYDRQRRPRTQEMARAARESNARNMNESALFHALTSLTVRLMPVGLWRRATARWIDWTPPPGPA
ncbi:MAG TPA: FAD-dependent monooxygenase, partial [Actinopolymorphaceae bacterium]